MNTYTRNGITYARRDKAAGYRVVKLPDADCRAQNWNSWAASKMAVWHQPFSVDAVAALPTEGA